MDKEEYKDVPFAAQFSIALLVTGNLIGAGILGIPILAGICGVVPAVMGMILFCLAMYYTACVLANETMESKSETFNYPSLYQKYLGSAGKWIAVVANIMILYGLLTAYLAGGTTIIVQIFNLQSSLAVSLVFFVLISLLTVAGISIIARCNTALIALLWISFVAIVIMGAMRIQPINLKHIYWLFLPVALPVIITAFHFHNIIPNVTEALRWKKKPVYRAMLMGMCIGFTMNVVWLIVGTGVLPLTGGTDSIVYCYTGNIPATVPMAHFISSKYFLVCAMVFSLVAIVTSYVANGLGLLGFCQDMLENHMHIKGRWIVIAVTFLPPFIVSMINPDIFLKAVGFVGGYGIVILFGILPCIIALIKKGNAGIQRAIAFFFLLVFISLFLCQIGIDLGLINIPLPK